MHQPFEVGSESAFKILNNQFLKKEQITTSSMYADAGF